MHEPSAAIYGVTAVKNLDGKVVLDLGGIHGAIEKTVDLWEVLLAKKNPTYDDKKDFLENVK